MSAEIGEMRNAIDRLSSSLSGDLLQFLNGFKLLANQLFELRQ